MLRLATPPAPVINPGDPTLAAALAHARQEASQARQVRYLSPDATGDWHVTRARPRHGRAYYRLFPGGRVEHHPIPAPRRRG